MTEVTYNGETIAVPPEASVLEALLQEGYEIPYSCRSGVCQTCLMQAVRGQPPQPAQAGLKETWKAQRYFLPCRCHPSEALEIKLPATDHLRTPAVVTERARLNSRTLRIRLRPEEEWSYRPGQYLTLWRDSTLGRSYSLASLPQEESDLELHVQWTEQGVMSRWLHEELEVGERMAIQGPSGECFYVPDHPEQPLLLVGTGTGLAPLYGILREALWHGHQGPIHLFHGALEASGLYLTRKLRALEAIHENVHYHPCVLYPEGASPPGVTAGAVDELALKGAPRLAGWKVFLCGAPPLVQHLRKQVFLAGANRRDIHSDAFWSRRE